VWHLSDNAAALQHIFSAYDTAYFALPEAEGCELWTGDRPFYQAVRDNLPWIKWIGENIGGETSMG